MFLKLDVAEERQTVVRCGGVNRGSVLPVATSAIGGGLQRDSSEVQRASEVWACIVMKRAHADAAAGKPGVQVGTPHRVSSVVSCCNLNGKHSDTGNEPGRGLGLGLGYSGCQSGGNHSIRVSSLVL